MLETTRRDAQLLAAGTATAVAGSVIYKSLICQAL